MPIFFLYELDIYNNKIKGICIFEIDTNRPPEPWAVIRRRNLCTGLYIAQYIQS